jgi:hypothetical protein
MSHLLKSNFSQIPHLTLFQQLNFLRNENAWGAAQTICIHYPIVFDAGIASCLKLNFAQTR